jgi:L-ascorbate metabolism protein UlaG (beta-lactamase superfamily)
MGAPQALAVTVSHHHANHSYWEGVRGSPKVLRGPGEYELSGIYITAIMTPQGAMDPQGKRNTAYLIQMENLRLCHLGDVSNVLSTRQVEELTPVDILFLPAGGICTVDIPQAVEMVQSLEPRIVIPMHYELPSLEVELRGLDIFLREMGLGDVQPQARLNVSTSSLPQEMRVVILDPQGLETSQG